jgi:hypothetical protein
MQPSPLVLHRRLDELVLEALAAQQHQQPVVGPSDSNLSIEVVIDEPADDDEVAVTHRFMRISAPYEAVEVAPIHSLAALRQVRTRPTTFARTINTTKTAPMEAVAPPAGETLSFDKAWFEQPDDAIAAIEDVPVQVRRSWTWLGLSLFVAAAAVAFFAVY